MSKEAWKEAKAELVAIEAERSALLEPTNNRYREACDKLEEIEDGMGDNAEFIDQCESCDEPIFEGEKYYCCVDSIYLCEACAPTIGMLLTERDFFVDDEGEPLTEAQLKALYDKNIAAGRQPTDTMAR